MKKNINKNILISSAGRRVELVNIWKKEAKKYLKNDTLVIANDLNPGLSAACSIADDNFKICSAIDKNYVDILLEECISRNIGLVIPTIDSELIPLARSRNLFEDAGIKLIVSDLNFVEICRNKNLTSKFFSSLGVESPQIYKKEHLKFPLIIKPFNGSSSNGLKIVNNFSELCKSDLEKKENIFQSYIPSDWNEYSVDLFFKNDGILNCCVPRHRLETRGGEISKGILRKNNLYEFIIKKFKKIKGARGPVTLQIFSNKSDNQYYGIELNARFGGGYPMSYNSGANYPEMIIREYLLNEKINFINDWDSNKVYVRYDNTINLETE